MMPSFNPIRGMLRDNPLKSTLDCHSLTRNKNMTMLYKSFLYSEGDSI